MFEVRNSTGNLVFQCSDPECYPDKRTVNSILDAGATIWLDGKKLSRANAVKVVSDCLN